MALLIVDNERLTRQTLRAFLRSLGLPTVREAHDGAEAMKILAHDKDIRFVICDEGGDGLDGLALAEAVAGRHASDDIPFLLMASDGFRVVRRRALHDRHPRVDGVLLRPFGVTALTLAMTRAHSQRMRRREFLLYAGRDPRAVEGLRGAMARARGGQWRELITVADLPEAAARIKSHGALIGGVVVDPGAWAEGQTGWLGTYRNSGNGKPVVAACLGREPGEALRFRSSCQLFGTLPAAAGDWRGLLDRMARRLRAGWDLPRLMRNFREARASGDLAGASRIAQALESQAPGFAETACARAEAQLLVGKRQQATRQWRRALDANPFFPGAYLKLLKLLGPDERRSVAEQALRHCPRHAQIRLAVQA